MSENPIALAKLIWEDPETKARQEYILVEGVSATIGRSPDNEIHIPERTVSRHHATVAYKSGVFLLVDAGSANGVFVNDERVVGSYPLIHGDVIRLYLPTMHFESVFADDEIDDEATGREVTAIRPRLLITSGALNGTEVTISKDRITFGRAIQNATWEVALPDHAVSRPHASIYLQNGTWYVEDLKSSNGTVVEGSLINTPTPLRDNTVITMGETSLVFRLG